jgi:AcrR family transcriptional regulator
MPRASAADAAATARRVLLVAADQLADRGHAAVSLDDVARAAGVTRGAVYHHYGSKNGLFLAVAGHLQAEVSAAVVAAAEAEAGQPADGADPGPAAALRAGRHAFLDAITAPGTFRVLLVDAPAVLGWQEWRRLDAEHSGRHLREALADVGVPADLLDATAAQLSGAMNESALWCAERPDDDAARRAAHRALDRLLDAVVGHRNHP